MESQISNELPFKHKRLIAPLFILKPNGLKMSKQPEVTEPNVVDEELVRKCISFPLSIESAEKREEMRRELELHEIESLAFSFQSKHLLNRLMCADILRIDNLIGLDSLKKLQLDNNIIEKIEGLDSLTNLEWLGQKLAALPHPPRSVLQQYHKN